MWSNYIHGSLCGWKLIILGTSSDQYQCDVIIIRYHDLGLGRVVERYNSILGLCKLSVVFTSLTIFGWWKSKRIWSALGNV